MDYPYHRVSGLILFYFLAGMLSPGVSGENCYWCIWVIGSPHPELPSTMGGKSDDCTPKHFNPNLAHQDKCPYGCMEMILYDYKYNDSLVFPGPSDYPYGFLTNRNNSFQDSDPNRTVVMTSYYRGCAPRPTYLPQNWRYCEEYTEPGTNTSYVFQHKCFCRGERCNGARIKSKSAGVSVHHLKSGTILAYVLTLKFTIM